MASTIAKLKKYYWRTVKLPLYKQKVLRYYKNNPEAHKYKTHLDYLKNNKVDSLLGDYVDKYKHLPIEIYTDLQNGLPYIFHNDNKLYFKRNMPAWQIKAVYRTLLTEQDPDSAHCYEGDVFRIKQDEVFFDIGAAEGIIALSAIDKVSKAVLFEYDKLWIEALEATFAPWKDKVVIVPKYAMDTNNENSTTIDSIISLYHLSPDFIKMDVEGFEGKVLSGMKDLIASNKKLKIALCTYHNFNDTEAFTQMLAGVDFKVNYSKGYMLYYNNTKTIKPPYFIRGVIRAEKY